jgi:hypothetical protein
MAGGRVVRLCRLCRSKSQWCAASRGAADHRCEAEKVGVEFYLRGAVEAIHVYPGGQFELRDPGLPLPTILSDQELKEMVGAAVESATSLKTNQRVTAELLNDSFFKMSPEASFLVRVSTVEALCPQADQTENFRGIVDSVLASIPEDASALDRDQIRQALNRLRSAYKSKIKQLFGDDKADKFDALYGLRSNFLHDGSGRNSLGDAADATLEIGLQLLLADIAHSAAPSEANQVNSQGTSPMPDRIISCRWNSASRCCLPFVRKLKFLDFRS